MQIHERIKNERIKLKLTEEEVAKRLGIKRSTYQYWESTTPKVDNIKAVASALGLPEDYFFVNNNNDDISVTVPLKGKASGKSTAKTAITGVTNTGQRVFVEAKDLAASYERIIEEKEARRLEAREWAERAEKEKDRLLKIIENNLTALLTNSNTTLDRLSLVETIIRSDDTVIMNNQDLQIGNEIGTSAKAAGSRQLAADKMRKGKGNQVGAHK